uniref:Ovule protein n=1 Tax=Parascaris equorum TaxID=6256 RepID=A0A914S0L3_PAREQ
MPGYRKKCAWLFHHRKRKISIIELNKVSLFSCLLYTVSSLSRYFRFVAYIISCLDVQVICFGSFKMNKFGSDGCGLLKCTKLWLLHLLK